MTKIAEHILLLLLILASATLCDAQVRVIYTTEGNKQLPLQPRVAFSSATEAETYVNKLPFLLHSKGYVSASLDSVKSQDSIITANLYLGNQYYWKQLLIDSSSNIRGLYVKSGSVYDPATIESVFEDQLNSLEDEGYPFAKVYLDDVVMKDDSVAASLKVDKGPLYLVDSIRVHGSARVSTAVLEKRLGIYKGSRFSRSKLLGIDAGLASLNFLEQESPWTLTMYNSGAVIDLYLKNRPVNQVNALIGFLPANQQLGGKLLVTGEALLNLTNSFGNAENINVQWQQLQPKSPRLRLGYSQPFFLRTKYGVDFNFELFKNDSSFVNITANIGLTYPIDTRQVFRIYLQTFSSRLLDVDTNSIKLQNKLPDVLDVSILTLGLQYSYNNLDYLRNPTKGMFIDLDVLGGSKTIRKNNSITNLKEQGQFLGRLYDSLGRKGYNVRLKATVTKYLPIRKNSTIKTSIAAGWLQSNNYLRNELFLVGGYRLLRGFDEESIFSNNYAVGTVEYRYLLQRNAYLAVFSDFGTTELNTSFTRKRDYYLSGGIGLSLETGGSIVNVAYAVGKRTDEPFNLRQSKIHIGFVAVF